MRYPCLALCCFLLVSACTDKTSRDGHATGDPDAGLPAPEAGKGSVTGMPDKPGPGPVGNDLHAADATPSSSPFDGDTPPEFQDVMDPDASDGQVGGDALQLPREPTTGDAVAVVRDYYAAINARQFRAAYALWSDAGAASGKSPEQFANGFADSAKVDVEIGEPGRIDAAAGSRYIEIPASITATQRDGSVHRYIGSYTLRRAVVDGATAEQRAWRIASAEIREVVP